MERRKEGWRGGGRAGEEEGGMERRRVVEWRGGRRDGEEEGGMESRRVG